MMYGKKIVHITTAFLITLIVSSALWASSGVTYDPLNDMIGLAKGEQHYDRRYINIRLDTFQEGVLSTYLNFKNNSAEPQYQQIHHHRYKITGNTGLFRIDTEKDERLIVPLTDESFKTYGVLYNRSTSKDFADQFWSIYTLVPESGDTLWFALLYEKVIEQQ